MVEPVYNIAICGGGNLAHGSIAVIGNAHPKYKINVYSRRPEVWDSKILGSTEGSSWQHMGGI